MKLLKDMFDSNSDLQINQLLSDSRLESDQGLFFALKGLRSDGHAFIEKAIDNGAVAVVHSDSIANKREGIEYIQVADTMDELHRVSEIFFDSPSSKMKLHAITGTNGKSTIMKTTYNIMRRLGVKAGYIGTISVEYLDKVYAPSLTTPDIIELQGILKDMVDAGITDVCLEISSQGLALRRTDALKFHDASYTNLSHDHLDYHKTMDAYFQAKLLLFKHIDPQAPLIINADDEYGQKILDMDYKNLISYGINTKADIMASNIKIAAGKTTFTLSVNGTTYDLETNLLAQFNVYNVLNVIGIFLVNGYDINSIIPLLKDVEHVEGRLTQVDEGQDYKVFVDFGHAPDSMANVYEYVRGITPDSNKLISVFGAAGARDTLKRPIMGKVSTSMCDWVIFTEHDNRNEEVKDITDDIISGVVSDNWEFIPIRIEAIRKALSMAQKGDSVILNGKGEEKFIYRAYGKEVWMGDEVCAAKIIKGEL